MTAASKNSKIIQATKEKIYTAFTSREALERWLAPNDMTGKVHDFNLEVGGGYTMSLFYSHHQTAGKTSGNEDRFLAKFVELEPYERIVQVISFQSDKTQYGGEMLMEVSLETTADNATLVTIIFKNIPAGIDPKDNETGTAQSLEKLAVYLQNN